MPRTPPPVLGHDLPPPRLTAAGWRLVALWIGLPALTLIVVSDLLGWAVAKAVWGVCFGLVCYL